MYPRQLRLAVTIWLLCSVSAELQESWERDRDALLELKTATTSTGTSRMPSWGSTSGGFTDNPCSPVWKGLTCENGRVTALVMEKNNIQGRLTEGLKNMDKLQVLNLRDNKFLGTVPVSWEAPDALPALAKLDLRNNELTGQLPSWSIAKGWDSLRVLDLGYNRFVGPLPGKWMSSKAKVFAKLEELYLDGNKLGYQVFTMGGDKVLFRRTKFWCPGATTAEGSWCPKDDPDPTLMGSLRKLSLANNAFRGPVPRKWARMFPSLTEFWVDRNNLVAKKPKVSSVLPSEWTDSRAFPSLAKLYLYPGNEFLCFVKVDGSFEPVNGDADYEVYMTGEELLDVGNPWICPDELGRKRL